MLNKLKKNNKKGFTLVELIVVLVILAILAALLIPALTGYIDKARDKQIIAETRQAVMAAQTLVDEEYATNPSVAASDIATSDIEDLAEVPGTVSDVTITAGKVTQLKYTNEKTCTYTYADGTGGSYSDPT